MSDFHRAILESGDAAVVVLSADDLSVRWASPAARRLVGTGSFPDLVAARDSASVGAFLQAATAAASRFTCAVPVDGGRRQVDLVVRDLRDDPDIGGLLVVASDVTGWAERAEELSRDLRIDPKTGLANAVSFRALLDHAIRRAPGPVVVFLDLDNFKAVNDRYGHMAGDRVLGVTGARLAAFTADRGTAARFGGDEFLLMFDHMDETEAVAMTTELLAVLGTPVQPGIALTASAGIAIARPGCRSGTLLREADAALHRAKAGGRGQVVVHTDDLDDWTLAHKQQLHELAGRVERLHHENRALAEAATIDQRTGLPNSAVFDAEHATLNSSGTPYGLLLIDIDKFHDYNTLYRYLAGHETLRAVGQVISRTAGRAYRYGGEEFTVLLPEARLAQVLELGERIRYAIEELGIEHRANPGGIVTASVGAATVSPQATVTEAVEEASIALLEAKDAGRNQVIGRAV